MRKLLLIALAFSAPASVSARVLSGCDFDGAACPAVSEPLSASGSETDRAINRAIDAASPLSGELLRETRAGERRLLQRTIDESPTLRRALAEAAENRTWGDYYQDRIMDAAVASWDSNLKAGYYKGTAAAYATFQTAPPVLNAVAGGVLWAAGVVYGLGLGLLASALTGHL